jgi:hypothetical protein
MGNDNHAAGEFFFFSHLSPFCLVDGFRPIAHDFMDNELSKNKSMTCAEVMQLESSRSAYRLAQTYRKF